MRRSYTILILLLLAGQVTFAQNIKAVLVELGSGQNRIKYIKKSGKPADVKRIVSEVKKVQDVTIKDFTDNFSVCPVYYFMDTNQNAVKNKQYDGNLFDAKGNMVGSKAMTGIDDHFAVVYYGFPNIDSFVSTQQRGLVVLNHKFEQVFFLVHRAFAQSDNDYNYISKKYELEYISSAGKLDDKLEKRAKKLDDKKD